MNDFLWDLKLSNPRISRRKRDLLGPQPLSGVQADVSKSPVWTCKFILFGISKLSNPSGVLSLGSDESSLYAFPTPFLWLCCASVVNLVSVFLGLTITVILVPVFSSYSARHLLFKKSMTYCNHKCKHGPKLRQWILVTVLAWPTRQSLVITNSAIAEMLLLSLVTTKIATSLPAGHRSLLKFPPTLQVISHCRICCLPGVKATLPSALNVINASSVGKLVQLVTASRLTLNHEGWVDPMKDECHYQIKH